MVLGSPAARTNKSALTRAFMQTKARLRASSCNKRGYVDLFFVTPQSVVQTTRAIEPHFLLRRDSI